MAVVDLGSLPPLRPWCDDCGRHGCIYPTRAAHRPRRRWRLFGRGRRD